MITLLATTTTTPDGGGLLGIIALFFMLFIYFLPWLVAQHRGKADGLAGIFFVNLIVGWTVVGWVLCFVWACTGRTRADIRREDQQHRELLAAMALRPR